MLEHVIVLHVRQAAVLVLPPLIAALFTGQLLGSDTPAWLMRIWVSLPALIGIAVSALAPGALLLPSVWPDAPPGPARLGIACALSMAALLVVTLWMRVVGLAWTQTTATLFVVFTTAAALWRHRGLLRQAPDMTDVTATSALLIVVFVWLTSISLATSDLRIPQFGDGLQHTVITQLIVDNGGLFSSWQPYAPMTTMTYHFGFHLFAAWVQWVTGWPTTEAVLAAGMSLGAIGLLSLFSLTAGLLARCGFSNSQAWLAGIAAVVLAGLVNPSPSGLLNWGRYTQLAGHVVLPVALLACVTALKESRQPLPGLLRAALFVSGLALTHYLVTVFLIIALIMLTLAESARVSQLPQRLKLGLNAAGIVAVSALISAPWWWIVQSGGLARVSTEVVANSAAFAARIAQYAALDPVTPGYVHPALLILSLVGLPIALWRRAAPMLAVALTPIGLVLAVRPQLLGLPGAGVIDSFTAWLSLYVFLAPLAGFALTSLLPRGHHVALNLMGVFGVALAPVTHSLINLGPYRLVAPDDIRAQTWIRENTPTDTRVLVNAFPAYWGTVLAGSDAGWWLTYNTGRRTNLPPLLYDVERGVRDNPATLSNIEGLWAALRDVPLGNVRPVKIDLTRADAKRTLRDRGFRYVYIGAVSTPARDLVDHIDVDKLLRDPDFVRVFVSGQAQVFLLR
jgi:hypothetical protein